MKKQIFITIFLLTSLFTVHSMDIDLGSTQSVDSDYSFYDTTINFGFNNGFVQQLRESRNLKRSDPHYRIFMEFFKPGIGLVISGGVVGISFAILITLGILQYWAQIPLWVGWIAIGSVCGAYAIPAIIIGSILLFFARKHYILYKQSSEYSSQSDNIAYELSFAFRLY